MKDRGKITRRGGGKERDVSGVDNVAPREVRVSFPQFDGEVDGIDGEVDGKDKGRIGEVMVEREDTLLNRVEDQSKGGTRRSRDEREHDLALIAALHLRGKSLKEIQSTLEAHYKEVGRTLFLSYEVIKRDLDEIRDRWVRSQITSYDEARAIELKRLDALEAAAWEGWERSLTEIEIVETNDGSTEKGSFTNTKHIVKGTSGSPLFLKQVESCIRERCKIQGLYSPEKFSVDWRQAALESGVPEETASQQFEQLVNVIQGKLPKHSPQEEKEEPL